MIKAQDLKYPFADWEKRSPRLQDGVLYIPENYDRHSEWSSPLWTGERRVFVEYCSGNGGWVVERARQNPDQFWIGVEKRFDRTRKIWAAMHRHNLSNLLVVCGEALTFTQFYLPNSSVEEVFVNFPDPWPKDRHAKHRLIQAPFPEAISRVVKAGGKATFVTDDETYSEQMIGAMRGSGAWSSALPDPYFSHDWPAYGASFFDTLWRAKGMKIRYHHFSNARRDGA